MKVKDMNDLVKVVSDIMSTGVITVSQNSTVREVLKVLFDNDISGAPVVSADGKVIGVLSSLDIIVASGMRKYNVHLHELSGQMSVKKEVVQLPPDAPIKDALLLVVKKRIGRVLIMEESGKLVGIVTRSDLLKYYATSIDT